MNERDKTYLKDFKQSILVSILMTFFVFCILLFFGLKSLPAITLLLIITFVLCLVTSVIRSRLFSLKSYLDGQTDIAERFLNESE